MSKSIILILFIMGLWVAIVRKKTTTTTTKSYTGGTSTGGHTHSTGRGKF